MAKGRRQIFKALSYHLTDESEITKEDVINDMLLDLATKWRDTFPKMKEEDVVALVHDAYGVFKEPGEEEDKARMKYAMSAAPEYALVKKFTSPQKSRGANAGSSRHSSHSPQKRDQTNVPQGPLPQSLRSLRSGGSASAQANQTPEPSRSPQKGDGAHVAAGQMMQLPQSPRTGHRPMPHPPGADRSTDFQVGPLLPVYKDDTNPEVLTSSYQIQLSDHGGKKNASPNKVSSSSKDGPSHRKRKGPSRSTATVSWSTHSIRHFHRYSKLYFGLLFLLFYLSVACMTPWMAYGLANEDKAPSYQPQALLRQYRDDVLPHMQNLHFAANNVRFGIFWLDEAALPALSPEAQSRQTSGFHQPIPRPELQQRKSKDKPLPEALVQRLHSLSNVQFEGHGHINGLLDSLRKWHKPSSSLARRLRNYVDAVKAVRNAPNLWFLEFYDSAEQYSDDWQPIRIFSYVCYPAFWIVRGLSNGLRLGYLPYMKPRYQEIHKSRDLFLHEFSSGLNAQMNDAIAIRYLDFAFTPIANTTYSNLTSCRAAFHAFDSKSQRDDLHTDYAKAVTSACAIFDPIEPEDRLNLGNSLHLDVALNRTEELKQRVDRVLERDRTLMQQKKGPRYSPWELGRSVEDELEGDLWNEVQEGLRKAVEAKTLGRDDGQEGV